MNFLAHLHLAEPVPAGWIGSLIPDLIKGSALRQTHHDLHRAIEQHYRVDVFTDTHPVFAHSKGRLFETHGRFSGILVDMLYDHVLARDWADYHDRPLDEFIEQVHNALLSHLDLMPTSVQPIAVRMVEHNWISNYATREGLETVLVQMERRLTKRFKRPIQLAHAMQDLERIDADLTDDFATFYPQLQAQCAWQNHTAASSSSVSSS